MDEREIILPSDDRAAQIKTVTGWVSRQGRFWGNDERTARYDGSTHSLCEKHGPYEQSSYCHACHEDRQKEKYTKLKKTEWNGDFPIATYNSDEWFWDIDQLRDHVEYIADAFESPQHAIDALMFVDAVAVFAHELDCNEIYDDRPEESDLPVEIEEAFEELNRKIKACKKPLYYQHGDTAQIITTDMLGIDNG